MIDVDFYVDVDQYRCAIPKSPRNRERPDLTLLLSCTCHVVITYMGVSEKLGCRNGRVRVFSPKLKSLKIGRYSFSDYTVIEIENMDSLEVIEIGDVNEWGYSFYYASLELKSILIHKA